ncbi:MAG TPA: hypothetical protein VE398_17115 [Acidobacteriota bacterium]|nr:hypothetical protein [Acidobacteriota bacterium]
MNLCILLALAPDIENNPNTDGIYVVYNSNRSASASGSDIYLNPVAGGAEL